MTLQQPATLHYCQAVPCQERMYDPDELQLSASSNLTTSATQVLRLGACPAASLQLQVCPNALDDSKGADMLCNDSGHAKVSDVALH